MLLLDLRRKRNSPTKFFFKGSDYVNIIVVSMLKFAVDEIAKEETFVTKSIVSPAEKIVVSSLVPNV